MTFYIISLQRNRKVWYLYSSTCSEVREAVGWYLLSLCLHWRFPHFIAPKFPLAHPSPHSQPPCGEGRLCFRIRTPPPPPPPPRHSEDCISWSQRQQLFWNAGSLGRKSQDLSGQETWEKMVRLLPKCANTPLSIFQNNWHSFWNSQLQLDSKLYEGRDYVQAHPSINTINSRCWKNRLLNDWMSC